VRRRKISLPYGDVAVVEFGSPQRALDVIFLHANGFNAMTYRQALAPLADEMRILAMDMRGHGRSTLPIAGLAESAGWGIYAADLLALIAALGARPRVVAGHSMGGTTALLAAPGLAGTRLVLFDPVVMKLADYEGRVAPDWEQPLAAGALRRKDYFADRAAAWEAYRGRGAFASWPDAVLADYLEDGLQARPEGGFALACPPAWEARNFAGFGIRNPHHGFEYGLDIEIMRAELGSTCSLTRDVVPGTSHFLPMERPDMVQLALRGAVFGKDGEAVLF
jgi:pimeloyl-ACP methyl ester carboxylesterase